MTQFEKLIKILEAIEADFKVVHQEDGLREILMPLVGVNPNLGEDEDFPKAGALSKIYENYPDLEENFDCCLHISAGSDENDNFNWSVVWNEEMD